MEEEKTILSFVLNGQTNKMEAVNADYPIENEKSFIAERTIEIETIYPVMHVEYFIRDEKTFVVMATQFNNRIIYDIKQLIKGKYGPEAGHIMDQMQNFIKQKVKSYMKTHQVKCDPEYFKALYNGTKRFEVRKDDRGYKVGDRLEVFEWTKDDGHLGRYCCFEITYILRKNVSIPGNENYIKIEDNFVILSLKSI